MLTPTFAGFNCRVSGRSPFSYARSMAWMTDSVYRKIDVDPSINREIVARIFMNDVAL